MLGKDQLSVINNASIILLENGISVDTLSYNTNGLYKGTKAINEGNIYTAVIESKGEDFRVILEILRFLSRITQKLRNGKALLD